MCDAGADVIKLEPPGGDLSRVRGSQRVGAGGQRSISGFSAAVNRGKRSIEIDLKSAGGQEVVHKLVATADVVIENFAPGAIDRLGIGFDMLRAKHPRLITVSINLWGVDSKDELAKRGGLALVAEAESGVMGQTRDLNGAPIIQSLKVPIGDMATGLSAYAAITTALLERVRTGRGQHLALSLVKTMLSLNSIAIAAAQMSGVPPATAAMGLFPTKDGLICIGVNSDKLWARLSKCMGRPELADDPRYAGYRDRDSRVEEVNALVADWTTQFTSAELVDLVGPTGLPIGQVASPDDIVASSTIDRLGWLVTIADGIGGILKVPRGPMGWSRREDRVPKPGENTEEILSGLGIDRERYAALRSEGVFG
jgi:crotonobetainyl-CoA:carnitine CoA-transferase CaiB-like acyl-CoA transferase